mmetsp:Transcript_33562/g.97703  ORF Transcript_33562/g.97703 Transcript_33562/m.97703 type:complete len:332 (-) Transcript_33562:9-1004(-)
MRIDLVRLLRLGLLEILLHAFPDLLQDAQDLQSVGGARALGEERRQDLFAVRGFTVIRVGILVLIVREAIDDGTQHTSSRGLQEGRGRLVALERSDRFVQACEVHPRLLRVLCEGRRGVFAQRCRLVEGPPSLRELLGLLLHGLLQALLSAGRLRELALQLGLPLLGSSDYRLELANLGVAIALMLPVCRGIDFGLLLDLVLQVHQKSDDISEGVAFRWRRRHRCARRRLKRDRRPSRGRRRSHGRRRSRGRRSGCGRCDHHRTGLRRPRRRQSGGARHRGEEAIPLRKPRGIAQRNLTEEGVQDLVGFVLAARIRDRDVAFQQRSTQHCS